MFLRSHVDAENSKNSIPWKCFYIQLKNWRNFYKAFYERLDANISSSIHSFMCSSEFSCHVRILLHATKRQVPLFLLLCLFSKIVPIFIGRKFFKCGRPIVAYRREKILKESQSSPNGLPSHLEYLQRTLSLSLSLSLPLFPWILSYIFGKRILVFFGLGVQANDWSSYWCHRSASSPERLKDPPPPISRFICTPMLFFPTSLFLLSLAL